MPRAETAWRIDSPTIGRGSTRGRSGARDDRARSAAKPAACSSVNPRQAHGDGRARQHDQAAHARRTRRRTSRAASWKRKAPMPDLERAACCAPPATRARAIGHKRFARRNQGTRLPPLRQRRSRSRGEKTKETDDMMSRMHERYRKRSRPRADEAFRVQESDGRARRSPRWSSISAWARPARTSSCWTWRPSNSGRSPGRRPIDHARQEVHREFQDSQGHADRLLRHPARRPHVRIPGPAVQRGAAARARFQGPAAERV